MNIKVIMAGLGMALLAGCASVATPVPGQLTELQAKAVGFCSGSKQGVKQAADVEGMSLEQKQAYSICLRQSLSGEDYKAVVNSAVSH